MFVDASAIAAILTGEADASDLELKLLQSTRRLTLRMAIYEAALSTARLKKLELEVGQELVLEFLSDFRFVIVPIGADETRLVIKAHARYGKGRHPARLNMGDCFAYACAKAHGAKLLFKGDDFSLIDVEAG